MLAAVGSSGFRPEKTAQPSGRLSPLVLAFSGFVPIAISYTFVSPSPSESTVGSVEMIVRVLLDDEIGLVLPAPFVATKVNEPTALAASVNPMDAEVPSGLIVTLDGLMAGGMKAGRKEKVAPVRLRPVTWKLLIAVPCNAKAGLTEEIVGIGITVKLLLEVAVAVPTVTVIGPVFAPGGTVTASVAAVAAVTVAAVPLSFTESDPGVELKFWPWIVTVVPTLPACGVKFRMASELAAGACPRVIWTMFPTASYV